PTNSALGSKPTGGETRGSGGTTTGLTSGRTSSRTARIRAATDLSVATPGRRARSRIGAALVDVPPMPAIDPTSAVMAIPVVPEEKRFCRDCGSAIGRPRASKPGRVSGFCSKCRLPFSFQPALRQGDLVADQYRVAGCLAYGGLGWIYLAEDERVANRWVV